MQATGASHEVDPEQFVVTNMIRPIGDAPTLQAIEDDKPLPEIKAMWTTNIEAFKERRQKYPL
jgi:hypothetical protein